MTTYAVAHLRNIRMGPDIIAYLEAVDETLTPYGGRFVLHGGGNKRVLEGSWDGDLIMIAFPDRPSAEGWYMSPAYQEILPLRTRNSEGDVILADGVGEGYRAKDIVR